MKGETEDDYWGSVYERCRFVLDFGHREHPGNLQCNEASFPILSAEEQKRTAG